MACDGTKHVMLSYNHKSKDIVRVVYNALKAENIPVWFDETDMDANMYDSMAGAVSDAAVVCCFMSPEYEDSRNTKLELEHAQRLGKHIIPCMTTNRKAWKPSPSKWLGLITGSIIAIDFSDTSEASVLTKTKELIERIRKEPSTVTTASLKLFEPIRQKYLQQNRIKRMVNEEKSFSIEQNYINLAIVESKEQQEKEKKLKRSEEQKNAILGTYEEIYGVKTSIDVTKLFEQCKQPIKKVLVLGRAGIGKSTFCQYVTYRWAHGELWPQYELVILIQLRKLTDSRYPSTANYSPVDLIKKEYFPYSDLSSEENDYFKQQINSGKVLWILDGYDEFVQNTPDQLRDVFEHILKTQHHILTSRPYAITVSYDVKMEITGFTDDNIVKYVQHFFDQIKDDMPNGPSEAQRLLNFLKSNSSIWGIAHIPVNIELICSLWSDTDWSNRTTLTMTALYENITEWLCRRHLQKQQINHLSLRRKKVYDLCSTEIRFLETLAFNAMECNEVLLPSTLLEQTENDTDCYLDDHSQLLNFGILKSYDDKPTGNQIQAQKQYYFVHLSFQEYFAARHLLRILNGVEGQKATVFITSHKYHRRFLYVFIFASGLLAQSEYRSCMKTFWRTIEEEPVDLVGIAHIKLIIECLDELEGQTLFEQSADYIKSISQWLDICVTAKASEIFKHLLLSLTRTNFLCSNSIIQKKLIELLSIDDQVVQRRVYHILSNLTISAPLPELISRLLDTLRNGTDIFQSCVCEVLAKMGDKAATKEVVAALISALRGRDDYLASCACQALASMGEKAATAEVIDSLLDALGRENDYLKSCACRALAMFSEESSTEEVIATLINVFRDDNEDIRNSACDALVKMGEKPATKQMIAGLINTFQTEDPYIRIYGSVVLVLLDETAATKEVIAVLMNALQSEDSDVASCACEALQKMDEKAVTEEVIAGLVNALQDEYWDVRKYGCIVLGMLGERAATSEVVVGLTTALTDEVVDVRNSALDTLGKMGEKAATKEVVASLRKALHDEDWTVRKCACEALAVMGEKVATKEVIDGLLDTLHDEYEEIRSCACKTLRTIGDKAATEEMVTALLAALQDEDWHVKSCACQALGQLGEKAVTEEVFDGLIDALQDENSHVRSSACESLGQMGEKAATEQMLAGLLNAFQDDDEAVRSCAFKAVGKLGAKAINNEVVLRLIDAFGDPFANANSCAYEALGKMGAKAKTNEIIVALVNAFSPDIIAGGEYAFASAFGKSFCSYDAMKQLDSQLISKLNECIRKNQHSQLTQMPADQLIRLFLETENDAWLPLVTYGSLLQQAAVTVAEDTIMIYPPNQVLQLVVPQRRLTDALVEAFRGQKLELERNCFKAEQPRSS